MFVGVLHRGPGLVVGIVGWSAVVIDCAECSVRVRQGRRLFPSYRLSSPHSPASLSLSLSLSLSVVLCLCLRLCLSLSVSVSVSVCLSLSLFLSLSRLLARSLACSPCLSFPVGLFLSLSPSRLPVRPSVRCSPAHLPAHPPSRKIKKTLEDIVDWSKLTKLLPGTVSAQEGKEHWRRSFDNGQLVKGGWTRTEDTLLDELVKCFGTKHWAKFCSYIPGRNGKQCRERWLNHLNPNLKKGPWDDEELATLVQ